MAETPNTLNPFTRRANEVNIVNFAPTPGGNASILATTSNQAVALGGYGNSVQFQNSGTVEVFVEVGNADVVAIAGGAVTNASDGSMALQAGAIMVFDYPSLLEPLYAAAITASSTSLVRISRGNGS